MSQKPDPNWGDIYDKLLAVWRLIPENDATRDPLGDTLDMVWRRMNLKEQNPRARPEI